RARAAHRPRRSAALEPRAPPTPTRATSFTGEVRPGGAADVLGVDDDERHPARRAGDVPLVERLNAVVRLPYNGDLLERARTDDVVSLLTDAREPGDVGDGRGRDQACDLERAGPAAGGREREARDDPIVDDHGGPSRERDRL